MGQAVLSVRMDEKVKRKFDCFCADAGMNASVAVNMFVRKVIRDEKIPFEVSGSADPFYSAKNMARIDEAIARLEAGKGVEHELLEVDDAEDLG